MDQDTSAAGRATVAALAVAESIPPSVPPSAARGERFGEFLRTVALLEARLLALESKGTESSPESFDRHDSIELVGCATGARESHVMMLLGAKYTGKSRFKER